MANSEKALEASSYDGRVRLRGPSGSAGTAVAHLEVGDASGYRRACEALRGRHPADIPEALVSVKLANVLTTR